jgi:hypothetical protein
MLMDKGLKGFGIDLEVIIYAILRKMGWDGGTMSKMRIATCFFFRDQPVRKDRKHMNKRQLNTHSNSI